MSEEQKEMQVEAAEKAAKKVAPVTTAEPEQLTVRAAGK